MFTSIMDYAKDLRWQAHEEGLEKGLWQGMQQGMQQGVHIGRQEGMVKLYFEELGLSPIEIAQKMSLDPKEVELILQAL